MALPLKKACLLLKKTMNKKKSIYIENIYWSTVYKKYCITSKQDWALPLAVLRGRLLSLRWWILSLLRVPRVLGVLLRRVSRVLRRRLVSCNRTNNMRILFFRHRLFKMCLGATWGWKMIFILPECRDKSSHHSFVLMVSVFSAKVPEPTAKFWYNNTGTFVVP